MFLTSIPKEEWVGKIVEVSVNQGCPPHNYKLFYKGIIVPHVRARARKAISRRHEQDWIMVKPLDKPDLKPKAVNPDKVRVIQ